MTTCCAGVRPGGHGHAALAFAAELHRVPLIFSRRFFDEHEMLVFLGKYRFHGNLHGRRRPSRVERLAPPPPATLSPAARASSTARLDFHADVHLRLEQAFGIIHVAAHIDRAGLGIERLADDFDLSGESACPGRPARCTVSFRPAAARRYPAPSHPAARKACLGSLITNKGL